MPIYIYIMDNQYNLVTQLGSLDTFDIFELNKEAINHNLNCLSFLSVARNTIYNHLQVTEIKSEINILKKIEHLKHILFILENAVDEMPINPKYYLRFIGE